MNREERGGAEATDNVCQHRYLLFCMLIRHDPHAWKSRLHDDGTALEGWFIAGTTLHCAYEDTAPDAPRRRYSLQKAVSYPLPEALWDLCQAREVPTAPPHDGHTSLDVLERLRRDLEGTITRKHEAHGKRATDPQGAHSV